MAGTWHIGQKVYDLFRIFNDDGEVITDILAATIEGYVFVFHDGAALGVGADLAYVDIEKLDPAGGLATYHLKIDTTHGDFPGVGTYTAMIPAGQIVGVSVDLWAGPYVVQADVQAACEAALAAYGVPTAGSGSVETTILLTEDGTALSDPVADADVWVTTDSGGTNIVAGTLQSNAQGKVTIYLDPGIYYVFAQKDGWNGFAGSTLTVV